MALSLKELISICEENKGHIDAQHHPSLDSMIARQTAYGDNTYASPNQIKYLRSIVGQFCRLHPEENPKPKSKVQELREKRDALLAVSRQRAKKERRNELNSYFTRMQLLRGDLMVSDAPTATIRHDRTVRELNFRCESPVKAVKR